MEMMLRRRSHQRAAFPLALLFALVTATFGRQTPSQAPTTGVPSSSAASAPAPATTSPPIIASTPGLVHSEEGAPMPGVGVRLTNTDTNQAWVTWTDESGKFEFPG